MLSPRLRKVSALIGGTLGCPKNSGSLTCDNRLQPVFQCHVVVSSSQFSIQWLLSFLSFQDHFQRGFKICREHCKPWLFTMWSPYSSYLQGFPANRWNPCLSSRHLRRKKPWSIAARSCDDGFVFARDGSPRFRGFKTKLQRGCNQNQWLVSK